MSVSQQFTEVLREWAGVFMRRSMNEFMGSLRDTGLTMPQLSTLIRLHFKGACPVSDIGADLGVTTAAASQLVERLVQSGLLERDEDPNDRRVKQVKLSAQGRTLILKGVEARTRWMRGLTDELSRDQQAAIVEALTLLTEAARKLEAKA